MITKCLFPVAGYGTRLLPATKTIPKEMLPLVNRPLIHHGVLEAEAAGIRDLVMITGRNKKALEDYFDSSAEPDASVLGGEGARLLAELRRLIASCTFSYTRQMEMKGLGHAVLTGRPLLGEQPFAVVLPDDVCHDDARGVLRQLVDLHERHGCTILAIEEVPEEATGSYGIMAGEEEEPGVFRVRDLVEKPPPGEAPSRLAVVGRYILTPDIFELLARTPPGKGGEVQLTDAILQQAKRGRVLGCKFRGRRFDCGTFAGMMAASRFFYSIN